MGVLVKGLPDRPLPCRQEPEAQAAEMPETRPSAPPPLHLTTSPFFLSTSYFTHSRVCRGCLIRWSFLCQDCKGGRRTYRSCQAMICLVGFSTVLTVCYQRKTSSPHCLLQGIDC